MKDYRIPKGTQFDVLFSALRGEMFEYVVPDHGTLVWNVTIAKLEAAEGNLIATVEMSREDMAGVVRQNSFEEAHLADVDITLPGVGAPVVWENKILYVMIDGTHRCVRAYREDKPFVVQLLTDEAAKRSFVGGPPNLMPWDQP